MNDDMIRTLLKRVADEPEPPTVVTIEGLTRSGRRRQWAARAATTVGVAGAVAVIAVGVTVLPAHFRVAGTGGAASELATAAKPAPPSTAAATRPSAPKSFMSIAAPMSFGWLPAGFSGRPAGLNSFVSSTDAQIQVAAPDGRDLDFNAIPATGSAGPTTDPAAADSVKILGAAPKVNGLPAYWTNYGLSWEYAVGGWAYLSPDSYMGNDTGSALKGWLDQVDASAQTCSRPNLSVPLKCKAPDTGPMSAQTEAALERIASSVRWNFKQQGWFPFQITHPLPAGWHITNETYRPTGISVRITAPGSDMLTVIIDFGPADATTGCPAGSSGSVTLDGASWSTAAVMGIIDGEASDLSTCTPVEGLTGSVSVLTQAQGAGFPGVLGAHPAQTIVSWLKFLGANPANWATQPLAG